MLISLQGLRAIRSAGLAFAGLLGLIAANAAAAPGDAVGASIEVAAATANAYPDFPAVASSTGGFVSAWLVAGTDSSGNQTLAVFARLYSADGTPLGAAFQASQTPVALLTKQQPYAPAVSMAPDGRFVVIWTTVNGLSTSIHGRRFGADGTPLEAEFAVLPSTLTNEIAPSVAMAADGSFVLTTVAGDAILVPTIIGTVPAYEKDRLMLRRFNTSGKAVGLPVVVDTGVAFNLRDSVGPIISDPAVAVDSQGDIAVTWSRVASNSDVDDTVLMARRYSAAGIAQGAAITVGSPVQASDVGFDASGRFVVVWEDPTAGLRTQRFNADGSRADAAALIPGEALLPKVAVAPSGQYAMAWETGVPGGVRICIFDGSSVPLLSPEPALPAFPGFTASQMGAGEEPFFGFAGDANGNLVAVLAFSYGSGSLAVDDGIWVQRFSGN